MIRFSRSVGLSFLIAVNLALTACGGGGEGGGNPPPATTEPPPGGVEPPPANEAANPVAGRVLYDNASGVAMLDLASGEVTRWNTWTSAWPSPDGTEIVHLESAAPQEGVPEQVVITDDEGRVKQRFSVSRWIRGYLKLSPDHQTLAGFWADDDSGEKITEPNLTLFSRTGTVIRRLPSATAYAWMPDGRLMYAEGQNVFIGDAQGRNPQLMFQTPEAASGLSVSPDGRKLAFVMPGAALEPGQVWMINIDGSDLHQVTRSSINQVDPQWMPDGIRLIVREGVVTSLEGYAGCPMLYAVPADAVKVELSLTNEPAVSVIRYLQNDSTTRFEVCPFSPAAVLAAPGAMSSAGSLPGDDGSVNRQLGGTMFYVTGRDENRQVLRLDVASGTVSALSPALLGTDVSHDGLEFAAAPFVKADWDNNQSRLSIQRADGSVVAGFVKPGDVRGPIRFSPSGQRLLYQWDANPSHTGPDAPALAIGDRNGNVLAHWADVVSGDWLPDGRVVAATGTALYLIDADFTKSRLLVDLGQAIDSVRASPDGSRLAIAMAGRLWVLKIDGTGLTRLTVSDSLEANPEWSPDGRFIAFDHKVGDYTLFYTWVVAADAQSVRVGDPQRHRKAVAIRAYEDGASPSRVWAESNLSWR